MYCKEFFKIAFLSTLFISSSIITQAQLYGGSATAIRATVSVVGQPVTSPAISDTGELSYTGGNVDLLGAGTTIAGVASVSAGNAHTSGTAGVSSSSADIADLNIGVLSNTITAAVVQSGTQVSCPGSIPSGSSTITGLQINGAGVAISGSPNQSITLFLAGNPVGELIINEKISGPHTETRIALHLIVIDPGTLTKTEVVIASARSSIDCSGEPVPAHLFGGRGTTLKLDQQVNVGPVFLSTFIADSGELPWFGGDTSLSTANATVGGIVSAGTATSTTNGGIPSDTPDSTSSSAQVEDLGVNVLGSLGVVLNADTLSSQTTCTCSEQAASCSGTSNIADLNVSALGIAIPISISGSPQVVQLAPLGVPVATLYLNEEDTAGSGNVAAITRNALRLDLDLLVEGTDLTVASSRSSIVCGLSPTGSDATLSGQVRDNDGRGLARLHVLITDGVGLSRNALTNSFGFYAFHDLPVGRDYIVSVTGSKEYSFNSRLVSLGDDISNFDFLPADSGLHGNFK